MKSNIVNIKEKSERWKFPLIAKSVNNNQVVLFESKCSGIVLVEGGSSNKVWYKSTDFINCFNKDFWEIPDIVEIKFENEKSHE